VLLAEVSGGAALHALDQCCGILIMWGMASVISWYKHSADKSASRTKGTGGNRRSGGRGSMRSGFWTVLGLTLLAGCSTAACARARGAPGDLREQTVVGGR